MKKSKSKKSFPDMSGDGKVTKKDILMARGVIKKSKMKKKKIMAKLCPRGKAAAKRKFKVYPSAYANMYASAVCSGKVTPGGKREKKAKGGIAKGCGKVMSNRRKKTKYI
jgi:hypothetical protein